MDKLSVDDREAREEALNVERSFIVQAPAGSGKTELLIQRYLKLLAVVDNPEEVLAITFTRKAAAEMQLRVLAALQRRKDKKVPDEEHHRLTNDLAGLVLGRDTAHEWDLIANPRRLRILTLDALNASIARAQPLSAPGSANGARIVVGAELQDVHRAAAVATLDWLAESGDMRAATRNVLLHVDMNSALYISYLSQMLATRDQWLPFVGSGVMSDSDAAGLKARFEQSLEFAVLEHLQRTAKGFERPEYRDLGELLQHAVTNLPSEADTGNEILALAGHPGIPDARIEQLPLWLGLAEFLLTQKGEFRKTVNKNQGFPAGDKEKKDRIKALLQTFADNCELASDLQNVRNLPPVHYSKEQWSVLLALFRLLPLAVTELKRLFAEQGIVDHVDVALAASSALGSAESPGDVALLLDYQLRHLLVDEMQDTSSAQYRMLEALTGGWQEGDGRTLFCVGDPMQSIYRFRNAEVGQFLLAREFGIANVRLEPLLLRRNFRSGENLVTWFNTVFPSVLAKQDDAQRGGVAYSAAASVTQRKGQGVCEIHPVFGGTVADEAQLGKALIARVLADNPDDKLAVLVRARTQLPVLLAELRRAGIVYQAIEIDRLTDLPEIIDVLALTRAAAHQGDRVAWLAVLRAPWIGLDWRDLHTLVRNDGASTVWELLQDASRVQALSEQGQLALGKSMPLLRELVAQRRVQTLRSLVERLWITLGGPAIVQSEYAVENVYYYFGVLSKLERVGTLLDVAKLESTLDMERVSNHQEARLQIMTMHRAKGLEFDHVLLFGLGRRPGQGDRRVLSWFDIPAQHGDEHKVISPVGPRADIENDPVHRYIAIRDAEKEGHEQARLLYVACTRAQKSLHLIGNTALAPDGETFRPALRSSLLHLLWPAVEPAFAKAFEDRQARSSRELTSQWAIQSLRRFSSPWSPPDAAAISGNRQSDVVQVPNPAVEFYWVGTAARIAGTLVHRWLQRMADGFASTDISSIDETRPTTLRWLRELGMGDEASTPIADRVEQALLATLNDERGQWILNAGGHSELALTGMVANELTSVVLDRVCIEEDGTHWIIDFKTSTHEGGNLQGFLQAESERYEQQLIRYAAIYSAWAAVDARCALYFPLLQAFIEVKID